MIPKQYLPVGGVPMLTRAIAAFAGHPEVGDVIVVIHPEDAGLYEAASHPFSSRLRPPAPGGAPRVPSSMPD
jgi:2-C-methyl-D-erythritol 4-phosphate cytidylyltransferase/2-C-methyl-D-erythritol 2,4-cyclodiphosphate synthase